MSHRPFLRSAIQVVGDFRISDFDRSYGKCVVNIHTGSKMICDLHLFIILLKK